MKFESTTTILCLKHPAQSRNNNKNSFMNLFQHKRISIDFPWLYKCNFY
uniref:Uncharacterized protein n=1 Tax=Rhizophora mucronata TaxID=61149 RepID=A0A2P2M4U1_RHIMU